MKFGSVAIIASSMLGLALGKSTPTTGTAVAGPVTPTPGVFPSSLDDFAKQLDSLKLLDPLTTLTKRISDRAVHDPRMAKRQVPGLSSIPGGSSVPNPFANLDVNNIASGMDKYMQAAKPLLDLFGLGGIAQQYEQGKKSLQDMLNKWKDEFDQKASPSSSATPSGTTDSASTPTA